jgi:hypothetical protein
MRMTVAERAIDSCRRGPTVEEMTTSVPKIQIGQLWKKDGTNDTYLVTRVLL